MEHVFATEHARAMDHLDRYDSSVAPMRLGTRSTSPLMSRGVHSDDTPRAKSHSPRARAMPAPLIGRKCRVPDKVLNPTRSKVGFNNGEGSSQRKMREKKKGLNAYVSEEAEEAARSTGQERDIRPGTATPSRAAAQFASSSTTERTPTPYPFAKGKGKEPIRYSPDGSQLKFNTAPGRLEPISAPIEFAHLADPPRPASVKEGKGKGKSIEPPLQEEVDRWRLETNASTTSSLHPGFHSRFHPRYSPLYRAPKELRMQNIDSVISPSPNPRPFHASSTLRYEDFFESPLSARSPLDRQGVGLASPVSTDRFNAMREYTGDTPSPSSSTRRVELPRPAWSPVSEEREALPVVSEAGVRVEVAEIYSEFVAGVDIEREDAQASRATLKRLLQKFLGRGTDDGAEARGKRKRVMFGAWKSRLSKSSFSMGRIFGRVRQG